MDKSGQTSKGNIGGKHKLFGPAAGKGLWDTWQCVCIKEERLLSVLYVSLFLCF